MKAKKYIKSTASLVAVKKFFNIKVIASIVASLMLLYTPMALYNYTKENGTLLYNIAEAQITSTVPIVKGEIKTKTEVEETSSYSVGNGFEEALENGVGTHTNTNSSNNNQNSRPSSTPTTNNNQSSNNQVDNSQNNNEVSKDLSFLKGTSISVIEGESFNPIVNLGIVAYDKDGTDITNRVSIDENTVDINNEGSYYVKASVKLNDGSILEKIFTVKVNPKKEITYEVNNFEMVENTAPKLGTARIFFDSKVSDNTVSPLKATVNGIEYNVNSYRKSGFGGTTRHYIDVNVGDISGEFKLNIEKIEFSNGISVWPNKQMNVYVIKSEPVVSNFSYTDNEEGKIFTTFDLKDLDNSLSNIRVCLYNERGILLQEHKVAKKEKYNLDFSVEANGRYTLEVIGDVNLYNDLNRLNQSRVILSKDIQVSKISNKPEVPVVDNSKLDANDVEISVGEELNISDLNIVALDKNGEDISSKVEIDTSNLDTTNIGTYEVLLTVVNSDNIKIEKIVKVIVVDNKDSNNDITNNNIFKARSIDNDIYKNNMKNSNVLNRTITNNKNIISSDVNTPSFSDVTITGNINNTNGNAPSGRIEVEIPTSMNFMVDQVGKVHTGTGYKIKNKSIYPIEVSVIQFAETKINDGITVKKDIIDSSDSRNVVNLELEGNISSMNLYASSNFNNKIAEISPNGESLIQLRGKAGNATNSTIDRDGTNEDFTVTFKINKKN